MMVGKSLAAAAAAVAAGGESMLAGAAWMDPYHVVVTCFRNDERRRPRLSAPTFKPPPLVPWTHLQADRRRGGLADLEPQHQLVGRDLQVFDHPASSPCGPPARPAVLPYDAASLLGSLAPPHGSLHLSSGAAAPAAATATSQLA